MHASKDARRFSVVGGRLAGGEPAGLVVDGGRIAAVGDIEIEGEVVDVAGGTVIPGFIDAHVHLQFATPEAVLAGGVTTVRDLGSNAQGAQAMRGATPLRVLFAGRILTPPGGYPTESWGADGTGREVGDAEDGRAAVREQVAAGASVIKVALEDSRGRPLFAADVLHAIVAEAHDAQLAVTAHVGTGRAYGLALEAGIDELAHLPLYDITPAAIVRAAEAGIALIPTLAIRGRDRAAARAVRAFREAGGEVRYGSDLGNEGTSPGIMLAEVNALLDAGMTSGEVLDAATRIPAAAYGLDTGAIEPGREADLVVLGGDPLVDPDAYRDIRMVIAGGVVIGR